MRPFTCVFFVLFHSGLLSLVRAYPMSLLPRQFIEDVRVPECAVTCAARTAPTTNTCLQSFAACLSMGCTVIDLNVAATYTDGYCAGRGIIHTVNGIFVTVVPPVTAATAISEAVSVTQPAARTTLFVTEFVTLTPSPTQNNIASSQSIIEPSSTLVSASSVSPSSVTVDPSSMSFARSLHSPAAISVYVILSIIFVILIAFYVRNWRRKRQGDFIASTRRSARGKSFLIDGESFKGLRLPFDIELQDKPHSTSHHEAFDIKLEDRLLPIVPIPTRNSPPAPPPLPRIVTAVTHPSSRNYVALPGRETSPTASSTVGSPPGLEKSDVSQTFAAGLERARNILGHTRGSSPASTSSSGSSMAPPSSSSENVYTAAANGPVPAYSYIQPHQPAAPSPLRAQLGKNRVYSTIIEEPRTPHSASAPSFPTAPPLPPPAKSVPHMHSTVETAQRARPTYASHIRSPASSENLRQYTFPKQRQSLNDTELRITISDALKDDRLMGEPERSDTPNGSMHRGAGGSVSSVSAKVQGKIQALVGGRRKESRD